MRELVSGAALGLAVSAAGLAVLSILSAPPGSGPGPGVTREIAAQGVPAAAPAPVALPAGPGTPPRVPLPGAAPAPPAALETAAAALPRPRPYPGRDPAPRVADRAAIPEPAAQRLRATPVETGAGAGPHRIASGSALVRPGPAEGPALPDTPVPAPPRETVAAPASTPVSRLAESGTRPAFRPAGELAALVPSAAPRAARVPPSGTKAVRVPAVPPTIPTAGTPERTAATAPVAPQPGAAPAAPAPLGAQGAEDARPELPAAAAAPMAVAAKPSLPLARGAGARPAKPLGPSALAAVPDEDVLRIAAPAPGRVVPRLVPRRLVLGTGLGRDVPGVRVGRLPQVGVAPAPATDPVEPAPRSPAVGLALILVDPGGDAGALAASDPAIAIAVDPLRPDAAVRASSYAAAGHAVLTLASAIPAGATASDVAQMFNALQEILPQSHGLVDVPGGGFQRNRALGQLVLPYLADGGQGVVTYDRELDAVSGLARQRGVAAVAAERLPAPGRIARALDRAAARPASTAFVGSGDAGTLAAIAAWRSGLRTDPLIAVTDAMR